MIIETERLLIREMTEYDFEALYKVLADSDIMQHYPYTFDDTRVKRWINKNIERYQIFGFGLWAVCLKETGEMIGDCGLTMQLINGQIKPEIGYHIRRDKQRRGYAKEAAIAVRDWTFNNTPFNTIYSYMKHTNKPSAQTAISYGCKQIDEFADEVNDVTKVFAISREEWSNLYFLPVKEAENIMIDRFGKDSIISLATTEDDKPYVRSVNSFYESGSFYVLTYGLSNKMKQITKNPNVAISGEWFTASGKGINLGYFGKKENEIIANKMKGVFSEWIDNGHNNFDDKNTCILQIELTNGLLFSHGTRYEMDFTK